MVERTKTRRVNWIEIDSQVVVLVMVMVKGGRKYVPE